MTQEQIQESNQLIAQFMGAKVINDTDYNYAVYRFENRKPGDCYLHQMEYHSSWDWLMPVVEKIEAMGHKTIIGGGDYWGNYMNILFGKNEKEHRELLLTVDAETKAMNKGDSKIEAVYSTVVDFIKWYNQQKQ